MNEWIKVEDQLPELDIKVLFYHGYQGATVGKLTTDYRTGELYIKDLYNDYNFSHITHWQPLPEPPNG